MGKPVKTCSLTLFGRPLAGMAPADADYVRGFLADLDWCVDCTAFRVRQAQCVLDMGAQRIANF